MTPFEKLSKYSAEVQADLKINDVNLQNTTYDIPQKKHYWVSKLILEKQELLALERKKKRISQEIATQQDLTPVKLSSKALTSVINSTETMKNLMQDIEDQQLLVEYLEKVEKIFSFITNDVKNIIETLVMER